MVKPRSHTTMLQLIKVLLTQSELSMMIFCQASLIQSVCPVLPAHVSGQRLEHWAAWGPRHPEGILCALALLSFLFLDPQKKARSHGPGAAGGKLVCGHLKPNMFTTPVQSHPYFVNWCGKKTSILWQVSVYVRILGNCILRYSLARERLVALLFWICGILYLLSLDTISYIRTQYFEKISIFYLHYIPLGIPRNLHYGNQEDSANEKFWITGAPDQATPEAKKSVKLHDSGWTTKPRVRKSANLPDFQKT